MPEVLANQLTAAALGASLTNVATTITLATGDGAKFPSSGTFRIRIEDELISVPTRSTDALTSVTRGVEGTTAAAHANGARVDLVLTQGALDAYFVPATGGAFTGPITTRKITDMPGTRKGIYLDWASNYWEIASGTDAAPITTAGPTLKVSRTENLSLATMGGNRVDNEANACIYGVSTNTAASEAQLCGVFGAAEGISTVTGTDIVGLYGLGRVMGSGVGLGTGLFCEGRRDTTTGNALGAEIHVTNETAADGVYNPNGLSSLSGVWVTGSSSLGARCGAAYGIGEFGPGVAGAFIAGYSASAGSVTDSTFRDDSSAIASLDVRGTHSYGLDLYRGTFTALPVRLKNNTALGWRNAADGGDVAGIRLSTSDQVEVMQPTFVNSYMGIGNAAIAGYRLLIWGSGSDKALVVGGVLTNPGQGVIFNQEVQTNVAETTLMSLEGVIRPTGAVAGSLIGARYRATLRGTEGITAPTVTDVIALQPQLASGTDYDADVTNAYSFHAVAPDHQGGGTWTNYIGVGIGMNTGIPRITNSWSIWSYGSAPSYHAGDLRLGATFAPGAYGGTGAAVGGGLFQATKYSMTDNRPMVYVELDGPNPSAANHRPIQLVAAYKATDQVDPYFQTYGGVDAALTYGTQTGSPIAATGAVVGLGSSITVLNSGETEDEHAAYGGQIRYDANNNAFGNTTPGRAWMTDWAVIGAVGQQQGALGGLHMVLNNYYNGPPRDGVSGAAWVVANVGALGTTYHQEAPTYAVGVGFGVVGISGGSTTRGWEIGVQVGGNGSNQNQQVSHLGTGLDVSDYDTGGIVLHDKFSGVTRASVTAGGSGYTAQPAVAFAAAPAGGTTATGYALLTATTVASATVTNGGTGYTTPPTVTVDAPSPSGTRATATATLTGNSVTGVTITGAGSGYTRVPKLTFSGGGGSGATATAVMTATSVASLVVTHPGRGYTTAPAITFSGGGGTAAAATAIIPASGIVPDCYVTNPGAGYDPKAPPTITFSGGAGSGAAGVAVIAVDGRITGIFMTNLGTGYTSAPTVAIAAPAPATATGNATRSGTAVNGVTLTNVGSGYYAGAPTVTFSGGGGTGAAGYAVIHYGYVHRVVITSGGSGYTTNPTVAFTAPPAGATATAVASLGGYALYARQNAGPIRIDSGDPAAPNAALNAPAFARISADQTTTSLTAVSVPGLSFTIGANEVWTAEFHLRTGSSSTTGIKIAASVPSGATLMGRLLASTTGPTAFLAELLTASATLNATAFQTVATTTGVAILSVTIANGATAGTVQLQFAKVTSGTATIGANSYVAARRVA